MITVTEFSKAYPACEAVSAVSFEVLPGQILGLVGPNGAGKTTTMQSIAGIIRPTSGRLEIGNNDVVISPVEAKRLLSYVPDEPMLFDPLTVWEHIQLTASTYGVRDYETLGESLLQSFSLMEKRNTLAQELSRGMRQKVAFACAYLHSPAAVLLDEPLTGLDPLGMRIIKESIREHAQRGAAMVISSHYLPILEDLCTHLLILHRGQNLFFGPLEDVYEQFASEESSLEDLFLEVTRPEGWQEATTT